MINDVHTLSGAYALDALAPEEAAEFRRHLAVCQACQEEVREFKQVAGQLGRVEATPPPPALKARILAAAARVPQQPPVVGSAAAHAATAATPEPAPAPAPATAAANVVPLTRRTRGAGTSSRSWLPRLAAAAAAVVLVGGGAAILSQRDAGVGRPDLTAAAAQVFKAPDAEVTRVPTRNGGELRVAVSREAGKMAVDVRDLPALDATHAYQVWSVHNGVMTSAAVLTSVDPGGAMDLPGKDTLVAITVEPEGGSAAPTTAPIVSVDPAKV